MLTDNEQREAINASGTAAMVAGGLLPLLVSVIYMCLTVKVKFRKALDAYQASNDSPTLPIRTDQPLTEPLETLFVSFHVRNA